MGKYMRPRNFYEGGRVSIIKNNRRRIKPKHILTGLVLLIGLGLPIANKYLPTGNGKFSYDLKIIKRTLNYEVNEIEKEDFHLGVTN